GLGASGHPRRRVQNSRQAGRERARSVRRAPGTGLARRAGTRPALVANQAMTPDQYCQDKAARSGSSFYYSFLFLPAQRRRAITALYAYCREVDDVVDDIPDADLARSKLGWWR